MPEVSSERLERRRAERAARRKRRRKRRFKIGCSAFLLLILLAFVAVGVRMIQVNQNTQEMEADKKPAISVTIEEGEKVSDIAAKLEKEGVIKNAGLFKLYVRVKNEGADFKAGTHMFAEKMSMKAVVKELKNASGGGAGVVKILVREGTTLKEIATAVEKATGIPKKEFMAQVTDKAFVKKMVDRHPDLLTDVASSEGVRYTLEGYLFPATYDYNLKEGLPSLITQMVDKCAEVVKPFEADIQASGHSVNEIMAMASLIEKEGVTTKDRQQISSVFYNRIAQGMPIQSDISILYALGTHKEVVTFKDLEVDSPYNLYKNKGLPPGPMNCPSKESIDAAVHPADTNYIYFYADLKTGKVYFTDDYEQHLAWQEEYEKNGTIAG